MVLLTKSDDNKVVSTFFHFQLFSFSHCRIVELSNYHIFSSFHFSLFIFHFSLFTFSMSNHRIITFEKSNFASYSSILNHYVRAQRNQKGDYPCTR